MRRTADLSGFGGSYEHACQVMLDKGIAWLREHPDAVLVHREYPTVFGLAIPESDDMKALEKAFTAGIPGGCTTAMAHCLTHHLRYIHAHGYDAWLAMIEEKSPKRIYVWDGTVESCPQTELSRRMDMEKA